MGTKGYYEAVAQIIPILFLTMAVGEARVRVRDTLSTRTAVLGVLFIGALLAAGEVAALRAIEVGHGTRVAKDLTAVALGVGVAWIVRSLAEVVYRDRTEEEEEAGIGVLIDAAFAVTAIGVICALIL
jgi:xanthine/uracil permease